MDTIYRIYCENVITAAGTSLPTMLAAHCFEACTVIEAAGYWRGVAERSVVIEVVGDETISGKVDGLAARMQRECGQECVMITRQAVDVQFVG